MSEHIQNPQGMKLVINVLMFMPIIFTGLLYLLASMTPSVVQTTEMLPFITEVLFIMIFVDIIIATKVIIPKAKKIKGPEAFGSYLIAIVLGEAISVYGLLIGLLQLFATIGYVIWFQVLIFMGISIVFMYYIYSTAIDPWLNQLEENQDYFAPTG